MSPRKINIFENGMPESLQIKKHLMKTFSELGIEVPEKYEQDSTLIVCIGGDGSLLQTLKECDFPETPIVGVNTGHLGFFQELQPEEIENLVYYFKNDEFEVQKLYPVTARVETKEGIEKVKSLNEIVIKGAHSHAANLDIFIGESFIEQFIGDGILVATPAGSTAYNYALGGSIVDPRLELLQVTPIAPINSSAYRSFTSSVLLPPHLSLKVIPKYTKSREICIAADGMESCFPDITAVHVGFSKKPIKLLRFPDYDFWKKVKQKLL